MVVDSYKWLPTGSGLIYNGYYTNPRIIELLGLEVRPPQGHQVEQGDITLIENVKSRGITYRAVLEAVSEVPGLLLPRPTGGFPRRRSLSRSM